MNCGTLGLGSFGGPEILVNDSAVKSPAPWCGIAIQVRIYKYRGSLLLGGFAPQTPIPSRPSASGSSGIRDCSTPGSSGIRDCSTSGIRDCSRNDVLLVNAFFTIRSHNRDLGATPPENYSYGCCVSFQCSPISYKQQKLCAKIIVGSTNHQR